MPKGKNAILLLFPRALLQYSKSRSCRRFFLKNAKPRSLFLGFGLTKPKSHFVFLTEFVSFWLGLAILALK